MTALPPALVAQVEALTPLQLVLLALIVERQRREG